ncbi:hypothetical protein MNBD_GAMMA09-317 [hydrothermal vent metagenome]|uniref:Uncharacterized protein n=1 Tax=hydrothermal vent metagenome TaxID=652676 RepID=A0A3B0X1S3_9ZZZZ
MDKKQLELIACPECHGKIEYDKNSSELLCNKCKLAFPVEDGIPVMLIENARKLEA